jgi:hypothetical protein
MSVSDNHTYIKDYIKSHYVRKCVEDFTFCNRRVVMIYPREIELHDISEYSCGGFSKYIFELHRFDSISYVMIDFLKSSSRHRSRFVARGITPQIYTLKYPRCGLKWEVLKLLMRRFDGTTEIYEREEEIEANHNKELDKKRMDEFTVKLRDENEYVTHHIEDAEVTVNILLILMLIIGTIVIDMRIQLLGY